MSIVFHFIVHFLSFHFIVHFLSFIKHHSPHRSHNLYVVCIPFFRKGYAEIMKDIKTESKDVELSTKLMKEQTAEDKWVPLFSK